MKKILTLSIVGLVSMFGYTMALTGDAASSSSSSSSSSSASTGSSSSSSSISSSSSSSSSVSTGSSSSASSLSTSSSSSMPKIDKKINKMQQHLDHKVNKIQQNLNKMNQKSTQMIQKLQKKFDAKIEFMKMQKNLSQVKYNWGEFRKENGNLKQFFENLTGNSNSGNIQTVKSILKEMRQKEVQLDLIFRKTVLSGGNWTGAMNDKITTKKTYLDKLVIYVDKGDESAFSGFVAEMLEMMKSNMQIRAQNLLVKAEHGEHTYKYIPSKTLSAISKKFDNMDSAKQQKFFDGLMNKIQSAKSSNKNEKFLGMLAELETLITEKMSLLNDETDPITDLQNNL